MAEYSRSKIGGMALTRMGFYMRSSCRPALETGVDLLRRPNQAESGSAGAEVSLTASRAASDVVTWAHERT